MSSTQEGSKSVGSSKKKTERNRRSWTNLEETTLIAAMKELIALGWKSDNGYRAGYLNKLEEALRQKFPNTDLRATPHINSKLQSWKKNYYSLVGILGESGVGFNVRGNYMIDIEDASWDHIVKVDSNARGMRYKMWPLYYDWKEIFGKDRATGENAEDVLEAANEILRRENDMPGDDTPAGDEESNENDINCEAYDRMSQSAKDGQPSSKSGKKRKVENIDLARFCDLLSEMNRDTNSRLDQFASRIGYDFDMGRARQETFDQLGEIPHLSLEHRFVVCELITFKAERLDIWRGMSKEARAQYVDHLLKTIGK